MLTNIYAKVQKRHAKRKAVSMYKVCIKKGIKTSRVLLCLETSASRQKGDKRKQAEGR
jgi:hypothetical protein